MLSTIEKWKIATETLALFWSTQTRGPENIPNKSSPRTRQELENNAIFKETLIY